MAAMTGLLSLKWNNHCFAFLHLLENLHAKQTYSDVTIVCQSKYYPVHRLVLSTCSDYFEEIFEQIQCKHPFIVLKDIQPEEFEALLNYMYKGVVNVVQDCLPGLIRAAEALKIKGLAVPDDIYGRESDQDIRSNSSSPPPKRCRTDSDGEGNKERGKEGEENTGEGSTRVEPSPEELIMEAPDAEDNSSSKIKLEPEDLEYNRDIVTKMEYPNSFDFDPESDHHFPDEDLAESLGLPQSSQEEAIAAALGGGPSGLQQWRGAGSSVDAVDPSGLIQYCVLEAANNGLAGLDSKSYIMKKVRSIDNSQPPKIREFPIYQCQHCSYQTKYKAHLLVHIRRRHTGERPFVCPYCDYKSAAKETLTLHLRKHTGYKPHQCSQCSYSSAHKCNLVSHIKRHTGDKPFMCHLCPYKAAQSSQLKRHMKVHDK